MLSEFRLVKMFSKEAVLLQQITQSREYILQKHKQLKHGLQDVQTNAAEVLQPVISPLNKIVNKEMEKNVKHKVYFSTPKKKSLYSQSYDDDETDEVVELSAFEITSPNKGDFNNNNNQITSENAESDDVTKSYLQEFENQEFNIDTAFGVRKAYGQRMIGNQEVQFKDGKVFVGDMVFPGTIGLLELLFEKTIDDSKVNKTDITNYQKIAEDSHLVRKNFKPNTSFKTPTFHKKFDEYLSQLNPMNNLKDIRGRGLPKFMIAKQQELPLDYKYWDDPNELVDRLRLLVAERSAGNDNHDNEIQAIIEELREAYILYTKNVYKTLFFKI